MKYKVLYLYSPGGSSAGMAEASFYTKAAAVQSADSWRQIDGNKFAWLWDGSTWTTYAPIP